MTWCALVRDLRFEFGGFETWVDELAASLPRAGVSTVLLLVSETGGDVVEHGSMATRVVRVPAVSSEAGQAAAVLAALEALAAEGLSGVLLSGGYRYIELAAINLDRAPWVPVPVLHGRDPGAFDWICMGPPQAIVAPAEDLARAVREHLRNRVGRFRAIEKVVCIPNGVPMPPPAAHRGAAGLLSIAAVSRLDLDVKRPLDYLHIAAALARRGVPFHMTIVGDGPARSQMAALQRDLGLADRVAFTGLLRREQVYRVLSSSDVMVHASESEACSLALAEAMACGCPLIVADSGGEVSLMANVRTGIRVPVGDYEAFADAISLLHKDRARREAMGAAARQLAEDRYSAPSMTASYAKLVRRIRVEPRRSWKAPHSLALSPGEALRQRRRNAFAAWVGARLRRWRWL